jgi:hypothetical protein
MRLRINCVMGRQKEILVTNVLTPSRAEMSLLDYNVIMFSTLKLCTKEWWPK